MATWKKVIVSGSNAELFQISASGNISSSGTITAAALVGDGSGITSLGTLGNALTVDNSTIRVNSGTCFN